MEPSQADKPDVIYRYKERNNGGRGKRIQAEKEGPE